MKRTRRAVIVAVLAIVSSNAWADAEAGKRIADGVCSACHGRSGIGITDLYPNLAGQKAAYIAAQLKAFRDGSRPNPIMAPMAKSLSDIDIDGLANYYSGLSNQ